MKRVGDTDLYSMKWNFKIPQNYVDEILCGFTQMVRGCLIMLINLKITLICKQMLQYL